MTTVTIDPGVCGFITRVTAQSEDGMDVTLHVASGCAAIRTMFETLGTEFDSYELCLSKPGANSLYTYAKEHLPGHAACPILSGVLKAAEVECGLALPKDVSFTISKT